MDRQLTLKILHVFRKLAKIGLQRKVEATSLEAWNTKARKAEPWKDAQKNHDRSGAAMHSGDTSVH